VTIPVKNVIKMTSAALAWKATGKRRPLNVMLALTDRCTGNCAYCAIPERKSPEMTTEQIRTMLTEAAGLGCQRLGLWGGEPLLRKDLGEVIAHAKGLGLFVTVDTNGHLIPKCDDALAKVDHLNISLDGLGQAHDALAGPGMFDRVMAGIEHARGRYKFWTITVLTKQNIDQIDPILDLARKHGFQTTFQVLHHNDQLGRNDGLYPEEQDVRKAFDLLLERKRQGAPVASSVKYLKHMIAWPDFKQPRIEKMSGVPKCAAGALYCNVDVNGDLYPCSLLIETGKPPNVVEMGFAAAFEELGTAPCNACAAACFTEYNLLYGLDPATGINWVRALGK
jgi:MoaA/NifB/PqqE/SkfB family radical SAM enzyme